MIMISGYIRNLLKNADLRKLTMRLRFILQMERLIMKNEGKKELDRWITKEGNFEASATRGLISKARIWEKIEKKQEECRKRGENNKTRMQTQLRNGRTEKGYLD